MGNPISFHSCKSIITIESYQAFSNDLQNRYSVLKLFLQNINVQKIDMGLMYMSEYTPQFFLYDSTLPDLSFHSCSIGTCA